MCADHSPTVLSVTMPFRHGAVLTHHPRGAGLTMPAVVEIDHPCSVNHRAVRPPAEAGVRLRLALQVIGLAIVLFFPDVALWLPRLLK